jgi:hypothetical protein
MIINNRITIVTRIVYNFCFWILARIELIPSHCARNFHITSPPRTRGTCRVRRVPDGHVESPAPGRHDANELIKITRRKALNRSETRVSTERSDSNRPVFRHFAMSRASTRGTGVPRRYRDRRALFNHVQECRVR